MQAKSFTRGLDKTQWQQVDDSVKEALEKQPNPTKYIICMPVGRTDPRMPTIRWLMDQRKDRVKKWNAWAQE